MSDDSGRLTPERAVRLLRAKAGELEAIVLTDGVMSTTDLPADIAGLLASITDLAADIALVAGLLADHLDDHDRHYD